jgi:hypothetical protein
MFKNGKSVSPVISIVLMIVVIVLIGLIIYAYASGYPSKLSEKDIGDYKFLVESQEFRDISGGGHTDEYIVYIRNVGTKIEAQTFDIIFEWYRDAEHKVPIKYTSSSFPPKRYPYEGWWCDANRDNVWEEGEIAAFVFDGDDSSSHSDDWRVVKPGDKLKIVHIDTGTPFIIKVKK